MIFINNKFTCYDHPGQRLLDGVSYYIQSKISFSIYTTKLSLNLFLKSCNNGKNIHIMQDKRENMNT